MNDFEEFLNKLDCVKQEIKDYKTTLNHILNNIKFMPENMTLHALKDEIRDVLKKYHK